MTLRNALITAALSSLAICAPALGAPEPGNQTLVCLATGSANHPWVEISPSVNGAFHGQLRGRNVVPTFAYQGGTYGQVWTGSGPTPPASCQSAPVEYDNSL